MANPNQNQNNRPGGGAVPIVTGPKGAGMPSQDRPQPSFPLNITGVQAPDSPPIFPGRNDDSQSALSKGDPNIVPAKVYRSRFKELRLQFSTEPDVFINGRWQAGRNRALRFLDYQFITNKLDEQIFIEERRFFGLEGDVWLAEDEQKEAAIGVYNGFLAMLNNNPEMAAMLKVELEKRDFPLIDRMLVDKLKQNAEGLQVPTAGSQS